MTDADAHADFTVFISYAHDDNRSDDPSCRWLERLLQQLKPLDRQGLVSVWSDKKIQTGERWHESIAAEVENADAAVLLVGPAFLGSEYIISNELPALLKNAQDRGVVVLPVIVSDCLFAEAKFKYPDPTHGPDELALSVFQSENPPDQPLDALPPHEQNKILASVARRILKLAQQPSEARSRGRKEAPKPWNVPHPRNPFFTGRAQILEDLRRTLAAEGKAALSGMGGVGKTQSAAEYAHRHRQDYAAVLWAGADTEESLKSDLAAAAVTLNLPEQGESDRDLIVAAVKRWLERNSNWLLILDNADDLSVASDFLSREWRGHLLLTTRAHATDVLRKEPVTEMTPEEGALFLLRRAKLIPRNAALEAATESDRDAAMELTREVGGLPLALDQAGAFIEKMSSTPAEYLDLYRKEGAKLRAERGGLISDHAPVTITFTLAFSQVAEASAAAARLLYFCAFLAPHAIPEEIFTDGAAEVVEEMAPLADRGIMVETIGEAGRFSLIRRNPKDRTIEIHRLVQQVIKDEMDEETQQSLAGVVVRALAASFPKAEYESWPLCEKMLPHAEEAARLVDNYGFEFLEAGVLLDRAAAYCYQRAQYAEAESLWLRVSDIGEKVLGPEDPNVAMALSNLAVLYQDQGRYAESEPLHVRAREISEKALDPEHPNVALCINNLAVFYKEQGRYAEVEPLLARALSINEKVLGPDHPHIASGLNNLASLYREQGKYAEAEPLFLRALKLSEEKLGSEHPDVAQFLNNLAILYQEQAKYAEAEPLYVRALSMREKSLGPQHPDVAVGLNNLAMLYQKQGKYAEAEPLLARSLDITQRVLGPEHPDVAVGLNNLASLYEAQGKYAETEPLLLRALEIREKALGPEHPDVALGLNNLAGVYHNQGESAKAASLLARALGICEKSLGPNHPNTSVVRENYTGMLKKPGAKRKARKKGKPGAR